MTQDTGDVFTRDNLVRAIQLTLRSLPERATAAEALEELAHQVKNPHTCESVYSDGSPGPCLHCGEMVGAS